MPPDTQSRPFIDRLWIAVFVLVAGQDFCVADSLLFRERLADAYRTKEYAALDILFSEWEASSKKVLLQRAKSSSQKLGLVVAVESLFTELTAKRLANRSDTEYAIIQNEVTVTLTDDPVKEMRKGEVGSESDYWGRGEVLKITRFAPPQLATQAKVLLLYQAHQETLIDFLSNGKGVSLDASPPSKAESQESAARLEFLRKRIPIIRGHWAGWHLEMQPFIEHVWLNPELNTAVVNVRSGYGGELIHCEYRDGSWVMGETLSFWIE